ncbi:MULTISPECIES: arsenate reductase family protein [unclassified Helicobacter]|uniref:arsenate reductase family protein n=1 Tax=unclassified Helicobacter TaxID=2593540 RepID=UPI001F2DDB27|nr:MULTISPECIES: Spx/MgsR family RNA polymerase-binding regulatory protein [unclassified Helicobacter]
MFVYGIKNCNSVKKARDFFDTHKISYNFIDFKKEPPTLNKIKEWVEKMGIDTVINKKGLTYKKLGLKDKNITLEEQMNLCIQYPSLIKRPVVEDDKNLIFGFCETDYREKFL